MGLRQAGQSDTHTDGLCHSPARPSLRGVSAGVHRGWVLEHEVWRAVPGRELLLTQGMGVRSSSTRNARGGSPDHHRSEAPLLSDVQGEGPPLTKKSTPTGEELQRRNTQWLLSQWQCSIPTYLAPQIRNAAKKQIWGSLLQQLGSRPHP